MTLKSNFSKYALEAGCDEAGRGCLSGPVVAAVVIFSKNYENNLINDSKKLNLKSRNILRDVIKKDALHWAVSFVSPEKIDEINILNASFLAMHNALDSLKVKPNFIIVDGNRFPKYKDIPHECIVKGDAKYLSIAAASILAKTYRDEYMVNLHKKFPMYDWINNKGYPTKKHREAIANHGITEHHRRSYNLLPEQLKLDF